MAANGKAADGGLVKDGFQAVHDRYQGITPASATIYLDPSGGDDGNDGLSWRRAKQTLSAAISAAPTGGQVLIYPGDVEVGAKITVDRQKCLTIKGVDPASTKQFRSYKQARIMNSGTQIDAFIETDSANGPNNAYGWRFENLYIEADGLADDGAFFRCHAVGMASFVNIGGRQLTTNDNRWLVDADTTGGNDDAWFNFDDIQLNGFRLARAVDSANYWALRAVKLLGSPGATTADGPAISISDGSQPVFESVHIEGWDLGVDLNNIRGGKVYGVVSESVNTIVRLTDCYDCEVKVRSWAGVGQSAGVERHSNPTLRATQVGGPNVWSGVTHVSLVEDTGTGTYKDAGQRLILDSVRGTTLPRQLIGNVGAAPRYDDHPSFSLPMGPDLPPGLQAHDLLWSTGVKAEISTDGETWTSYAATDSDEANRLLRDDPSTLTIQQSQQRFRLTSDAVADEIRGLLFMRMWSYGTPGRFTIRGLNADGSTASEQSVQFGDAAEYGDIQFIRGLHAVVNGGVRVQVEGDFDLSGGGYIQLQRMAFLMATSDVESSLGGRQSRSRLAPSGTGVAGDLVHVVAGDDAGLWQSDGSDWSRMQTVAAVATGDRPSNVPAGWQVFDTTLGQPVWYTGTGWVTADGTSA